MLAGPGQSAVGAIRQNIDRGAFDMALMLLRMYPKSDEVMKLERELFKAAKGRAIFAQRGPQERLMTTTANVVIYGGGAGSGKSHGVLMYITRYVENGDYRAIYFRKTNTETRQMGGLWDEACKLWGEIFNAKMLEQTLNARFPSGAKIQFAQLHKEGRAAVEGFKGLQAPTVIFDEGTAFEEDSIFYINTRQRSSSEEFQRQMLITTNPDRDGWPFKFVRPWVDDSFPVEPEADGMCAFIRCEEAGVLPPGVKPSDVIERDQNVLWVKRGTKGSRTIEYIHATLADNIFIEDDYINNIMQADRISRIRLLGGPQAWHIRFEAGEVFKREWWQFIDWENLPPMRAWVRSWDFAGRKKRPAGSKGKAPDYTASVLIGITAERWPRYVVADVTNERLTPAETENRVAELQEADQNRVGDHTVLLQRGGGDAGFHVDHMYRTRVLPGKKMKTMAMTGTKEERAKPMSALAEKGMVLLVHGDWNEAFIEQARAFPEGSYDDMVDAGTAGVLDLQSANTSVKAIGRARKTHTSNNQW